MGRDILLLVLGGIISFFFSIIGWLIKKKISSSNKSKIPKEQLSFFYAPLYNSITASNGHISEETWNLFETKCAEHSEIIPKYFSDWRKEKHFRNNEAKVEEFKKHTIANYTYLRKKFHYSAEKVEPKDYKYLDCYEKRSNIASYIYLLYNLLPIIFMLLVTLPNNLISNDFEQILVISSITISVSNVVHIYLKKWYSDY